jgi:hypothetical protein
MDNCTNDFSSPSSSHFEEMNMNMNVEDANRVDICALCEFLPEFFKKIKRKVDKTSTKLSRDRNEWNTFQDYIDNLDSALKGKQRTIDRLRKEILAIT